LRGATVRDAAPPRRIAMRAQVANLLRFIPIAAISGCATAGPPPASPPTPAVAVSFDGNYQGTIRLTSTSSAVSGAGSNWCDTPPVISLSVQNSAFSYVLAHPNVPRDSSYSLSPTFAVTVAPGGSFHASSQNGEAEMAGHITGLHMAGQISGTGCGYAFTAERS
jgi:hypothetical protein